MALDEQLLEEMRELRRSVEHLTQVLALSSANRGVKEAHLIHLKAELAKENAWAEDLMKRAGVGN